MAENAGQQASGVGVYGPRSLQYGGPDYSQLRPYGPGYGPHHSQPYNRPYPPNTTIYGQDSRYYGGPRFDQLRPGGGSAGAPPRGWHAPVPRGNLYGQQSRRYGGPDYSNLRPGYQGVGPNGRAAGQSSPMTGPMRGDGRPFYGQHQRMFSAPNYNRLRPGDAAQGQGPDGRALASPRSDLYGRDSRRYGGPDYGRLDPEGADSSDTGTMAATDGKGVNGKGDNPEASPDTNLYGDDSQQYGGADYSSLKPDEDS
jgi:hypothetical protein